MRKKLTFTLIGLLGMAMLLAGASLPAQADSASNRVSTAQYMTLSRQPGAAALPAFNASDGGSENFTATLITRLAGILGISEDTLASAYNQAMQTVCENRTISENMTGHGPRGDRPPSDNGTPPQKPEGSDNWTPPARPEGSDNMTPPAKPEGSDNMTPPGNAGFDNLLVETMAGILNIDEDKLSEAFQQVMEAMRPSGSDNMTPPQRPSGSDNMTPPQRPSGSDNMTGPGGPPPGGGGPGGGGRGGR